MESEAAAYGIPYLGDRLFRLMTLRAVRPDICKAWNDHDVRPEVLRLRSWSRVVSRKWAKTVEKSVFVPPQDLILGPVIIFAGASR